MNFLQDPSNTAILPEGIPSLSDGNNKVTVHFTPAPIPPYSKPEEAVEEMARKVIRKYPSLLDGAARANIAYLMLDKAKFSRGFQVLGSCHKCPDLHKSLHGFDFVITMDTDFWYSRPEKQEALLAHELRHIHAADQDDGSIKFSLRPHDIQRFKHDELFGWDPEPEEEGSPEQLVMF